MERYVLLAALFVGVVIPPAFLGPNETVASASADKDSKASDESWTRLDEARRWRASRVFTEYLPAAWHVEPGPRPVLRSSSVSGAGAPWLARSDLRPAELTRFARSHPWSRRIGPAPAAGGTLADLLAVPADSGDRARGLEAIAAAGRFVRAGDARRAAAEYDAAIELLPQIGDWLGVLAASAAALAGDTAGVRERLDRLDRALSTEWGWRIRVRARHRAGDVAGAALAAEWAANALLDASGRSEAWSLTGELRRMRGDRAGARAAFVRAMEAAPSSAGALTAARMLSEMPEATPRERLRAGRVYLRHGNLTRGISGLRAFLEAGAGSEIERAEVRLELARALLRDGDATEGREILRQLSETAVADYIRAEALLELGRDLYRNGKAEAGRTTFLHLAERFPRERATADALFTIADLEHDEHRLSAARHYYERAAAARPGSARAGSALMRLGGLAYAQGDFAAAARIFETYRRQNARGAELQQATYWAGRAYLELGLDSLGRARLNESRREDPFSYYGIRAAEWIGEAIWEAPIEASPPRNPAIDAMMHAAVARFELLEELGWRDIANFELERLQRYFQNRDGALYSLAEAFNARGRTFIGVRLGWEIHRRERVWNRRLLRIIYPFPYRDLILAEAQRFGLDPFLVAGLIRQESMFQPAIRSSAGAIGLMQIMPATGRALASHAGVNAFDAPMLERPELNVHLGIRYLADLLARYDDRVTAALAAYNAGPSRVTRWRRFPEWMDDELFVERIPFSETREYVKIVTRNARMYAALYPFPSGGTAASD